MPSLDTHLFDLSRVIQLAIAPVFLLTAIATLINVLIARLARAVDRRRTLEEHIMQYDEERRGQAAFELRMLHRRVVLILWAVALPVLAPLLVSLLIATAFPDPSVPLDLSRPVAALFLPEISISALSARQTVSPQGAREALK